MSCQAGASVQRQTHDGSTALHYASQAGHVAIMEVLLAAGAELACAANNGATPLAKTFLTL